jgi:hypothetical protein
VVEATYRPGGLPCYLRSDDTGHAAARCVYVQEDGRVSLFVSEDYRLYALRIRLHVWAN